jgi:hypothetical protein
MELEEKPPDPSEQVYRIIKCPLKCVLKKYYTLHPIIEKAVIDITPTKEKNETKHSYELYIL